MSNPNQPRCSRGHFARVISAGGQLYCGLCAARLSRPLSELLREARR